jgi:16S rRNA processing protein RimM
MDDGRTGFRRYGQVVRLGRITGIHGLAGALRLKLDNPQSSVFTALKRVRLIKDSTPTRMYQVCEARSFNRGGLKLVLEGVTDANQAELLVGAIAFAEAADLPAAEAGEFYYFEAIGCAVYTTDGRQLGTIEEVFATGANDVWIVRGGGAEILIPVIEDIVKSMDFAGRSVVVDPLPGLLD